MNKPGTRSRLLGCALAACFAAGCAPSVGGRGSFPLVSRAPLPGYQPVAEVDEKRCSHDVLFFWAWGDDPNHEALVTDILEQYKGDAIANAEVTYFQIPAFVYIQSCARVRGTVVRRAAVASNEVGR